MKLLAMILTRQTAVQLVGPDQLDLNRDKAVARPGPGRVGCVGPCASDMKLVRQFDRHARKTPGDGVIERGKLPSQCARGQLDRGGWTKAAEEELLRVAVAP